MTKIDTVREAIHAIEAATLYPDPELYLIERDADVVERIEKARAWVECSSSGEKMRAVRAHTQLQEELIFLRLAKKLLPVIGPLLARDNDELLIPVSTATSTA